MPIPTITTTRLILRPFSEEDVDPLHRILSVEGVLRYFPRSDPPARDKVRSMVVGQLKHWEEHGYGWWAVERRSAASLIGWNGLGYLPETEEVEVSYLLAKPFWGQGLATEAARASLSYGFERIQPDSVVGIVHPDNLASRRVLEKLGMSFIERARYFGMDCCRYVVERSTYLRFAAEMVGGNDA